MAAAPLPTDTTVSAAPIITDATTLIFPAPTITLLPSAPTTVFITSTWDPSKSTVPAAAIDETLLTPSTQLAVSTSEALHPHPPTQTVLTYSPVSTSSRISASSPSSASPSLPASSTSLSSTIDSASPTPQLGGLSASAKVGIGLGVPLGVIVLAIVAVLGYLYGKRRGNKRNAIPAADEQFHGFPGDKDSSAMQRQDGAGAVGPQESEDNGGLPRYAEELEGSPGVKRHQLPAQREAAGYFSPDVVTS